MSFSGPKATDKSKEGLKEALGWSDHTIMYYEITVIYQCTDFIWLFWHGSYRLKWLCIVIYCSTVVKVQRAVSFQKVKNVLQFLLIFVHKIYFNTWIGERPFLMTYKSVLPQSYETSPLVTPHITDVMGVIVIVCVSVSLSRLNERTYELEF